MAIAAELNVSEDVVVTALADVDAAALRRLTSTSRESLAADLYRRHVEMLSKLAGMRDRALANGQTREVIEISREERQALKAYREMMTAFCGFDDRPIARSGAEGENLETLGDFARELVSKVLSQVRVLGEEPTSLAELADIIGRDQEA